MICQNLIEPNGNVSQKGYQSNQTPRNHMERGRPPNTPLNQATNQLQQQNRVGGPSNAMNSAQQPNRVGAGGPLQNRMANQQQQQHQQQQQQMQGAGAQAGQKKARYFLAMFDYDPTTMSPNPDGCEEELPFQEGDTIKVSFFLSCSSLACRSLSLSISLGVSLMLL